VLQIGSFELRFIAAKPLRSVPPLESQFRRFVDGETGRQPFNDAKRLTG
jgi:hypothetical protein